MKVKNYSNTLKDIKIAEGIFFEDLRGSLKKTMYSDLLFEYMGSISEVICTTSKVNVVRGLHYQSEPHQLKKFVTCVSGEILDVFLDIRKDSPTFGQFGTIKLHSKDNYAVLIPEGFAHGYSTLSEESIVVYLQSGNFDKDCDRSINPLSLNIDWLVENPIVSEKDKNAASFQGFKDNLNE